MIRMRGLVDRDAIALFGPLAPGERSAAIHVQLKRDGEPVHVDRGDWLPPGVLEKVCLRARREATRLAQQMRDRRIDVRPCRHGGRKPCDHCPFGDVCRIDPRTARYRAIISMRRSDVIEGILASRS